MEHTQSEYRALLTLDVTDGLDSSLSFRMPTLLEKAGLRTIYTQKCVAPFGKLCERYPALADEVERTASSSDMMHADMSAGLLQRGILEAPKGTRLTTEEERKSLAEEMSRGVREEGAWIVLFEFLVTKP